MEQEYPRGPHGWINWRAQAAGQPHRQERHPDNILIRPIWQEFVLYSDADLSGAWLEFGPYLFMPLDPTREHRIGTMHRSLLLRVNDHLVDAPLPDGPRAPATDIEDYVGGDIGAELAALLGLALGCRLRSGGMVRQGLPESKLPLGFPTEDQHRAPHLEPPHRRPMIATLADPIDLSDGREPLETYPSLAADDAVALVRSAGQFVDGLWLADADPRLAWIKMVGALEAAAARFDFSTHATPAEQLRTHRPTLYRELAGTPELLAVVAGETSQLFRVQAKLRAFVKRFGPPAPPRCPADRSLRVHWRRMRRALDKIYEHRSRDLHAGIPFPAPLCEPPMDFPDPVPAERLPFIGISTLGGEWTADELPIYLHVFAYVVGESLRAWWSSLASPVEAP